MTADRKDNDNSPQLGGGRYDRVTNNEPQLGGTRRIELERYKKGKPVTVRFFNLYEELESFESQLDLDTNFDKKYQLVLQSILNSLSSFAPNPNVYSTPNSQRKILISYIDRFFGFTPDKGMDGSTVGPNYVSLTRTEPVGNNQEININLVTRNPYYDKNHVDRREIEIKENAVGFDEEPDKQAKFTFTQDNSTTIPEVTFSFSNSNVSLTRRYTVDANGTLQKQE